MSFPVYTTPVVKNIPAELRSLRQWVRWEPLTVDGRCTKVPFRARAKSKASATNPATWDTFEAVIQTSPDRIGFMFSPEDPYFGIDLDKCIDAGEIATWAQAVINRFPDAYAERSVSGTGVHLIGRGALPPGGNRKGHVEVYDRARFFTFTGDVLPGREGIGDCSDELAKWHAEIWPPRRKAPAIDSQRPPRLEDQEMLNRARGATNGERFAALFDRGDLSAHGGDDSAADLALMNILRFWTRGDPGKMERLFSQSALGQRTKWQSRQDYRARTIKRALDSDEVYNPAHTVVKDILPDGGPVWREPIPLDEPAGPPFPVADLSGQLGAFVATVAESTQTPPDLAGVLALGTLSAAARGRYAVNIPEHDWREPLVLQVVPFLESGERKSAVFAEITAPVSEWEREQHRHEEVAIRAWESRKRVLAKQLEVAERASAKGGETVETSPVMDMGKLQRQDAVEELVAHEMTRPHKTRVVAHDVTPEMAKQMIVEQGGALAIMEAEGTFFSILAGRYQDGKKSAPLEVMLTGHAGEAITVDRKSAPSLHTPRGHLTIAVACQPHVAEAMGAVDGFRDRGGAARILPAFPPSKVGKRSPTAAPIPDTLRATWVSTIRRILEYAPQRMTDSGGCLRPADLTLSREAYAAFQEFRCWHEPQLTHDGSMGDFRDWGSKLPGAVLRIAGLLHLAMHNEPERLPITVDTLTQAVRLGAYFTDHARVMYRVMAGRSSESDARQVLDAIRTLANEESPVPRWRLHRALRGRRALARAADLKAPLDLLEEYGWIRCTRKPTAGRDGEHLHLNPYLDMAKTPESADATLTEELSGLITMPR